MNRRAAAYLATHRVTRVIQGIPELVLPLDTLQGFLDLLGPADVPSYQHVQRLYQAQATAVYAIQTHVAQSGHQTTDAPRPQLDETAPRSGHADE